ncbi:unnamed protein product [Lasius platythorax]|uniref:Uncharacterized protein n=1 Tax=Lasius platythorax TaxID=488582 RepID=A0AAV2P0S4_9HYME
MTRLLEPRDDGSFLGTGTFSWELYTKLRHTRRFIVFATVSGIHLLIRDGENRFGEIQRDASSASLSLILVAVVAIDLGIRPRAFASLQNLENSCYVFSREQPGWLRSCLLRCCDNGISVVTAPRVSREYAR